MSENDCMICFNDYEKPNLYGCEKCFPQHVFCLECILCIYSKGLECPIDKIKSSTIIKWDREDNIVRYKDVVRFCVKCIRNLDNQFSFGFEKCFDHHRFCEYCARKYISVGGKCPLDDGISSKMLLKNHHNVTVVIEQVYFDTLSFLSAEIKGYFVAKELYLKLEYPVHVCLSCADDLEGKIMFGFEDCFNKHRICYTCISRQYYDYGWHKYLCPSKSRLVCQRADMSFTVFDNNFYWVLRKFWNKVRNPKRELIIQSMLDTAEYNLDICLLCEVDINDKISYGEQRYNYNHRICGNCVKSGIECYTGNKVLIKNKSKEPVIVSLDLYYIIHYLDNAKRDSDKAQPLIERILAIKEYPLDVCLCCLCDLIGQSSYSYESCFNNHRMCFNCAINNIGYKECVLDTHIHSIRAIVKYGVIYEGQLISRKLNVMEENKEKQIRTITSMLFRTISLLYEGRDNDSKVQSMISTMLTTLQFPLDNCISCLDDISNKCKYGYPHCFDFHRMCEECAIGISKCKGCNKRGNIHDLTMEDEHKQIVNIDENIVELINYINENLPNSVNANALKRNLLTRSEFPLNICIQCLNDLQDCSSYGYDKCFDKHRYCQVCIIECDLFMSCCRRNTSKYLKMKTKCGETDKIEIQFFNNINLLDYIFKYSEKWQLTRKEMLATLKYQLHVCLGCMKSLEGVSTYGYERCFDRHRMCQECALEIMTSDKCLVDGIISHTITIMNTNKEIVTFDSIFLQIRRFLRTNSTYSKKWQYMLDNVSYSLDMCINCLTNISNNLQYGYEEHFNHYRFCKTCTMDCVITDRYLIIEMMLEKENLKVEYEDKSQAIIDNHFLEIMRYIKHRSSNMEDRECLFTKLFTSLEYPVNICLDCFKNIECEISFSFESCIHKHQVCQECFLTNENVLQCRGHYILQGKENQTQIIESPMVKIMRHFNSNTTNIQKSKWAIQRMIDTLEYPLDICVNCLDEFKCSPMYGYDNCFDHHRMCKDCALMNMAKLWCFNYDEVPSVIVEGIGN